MAVTVNAAEGRIRYGYYSAALLRPCTVTRSNEGVWSLTGTLLESDAIWLTRQPLALVVTNQRGAWTWPIVELPQIAGGVLTARLGPPEMPDGHHRQAEDRSLTTQ